MTRPVRIVGFGGTLRAGSSTERAVQTVLEHTKSLGADIRLISGPALEMPLYNPADPARTEAAKAFIEALRWADSVVIGSPGYHGSVSGLVKNAIDYIEDMSADARPYLDGMAVGLIASGAGMAGSMTTLGTLRDIAHALRACPTPFGYAFNSADRSDEAQQKYSMQMELLGQQVFGMARKLKG